MITATSPANLLLMVAGFALWGVALNVLYGTESLGCELGWNRAEIGPVSLQRVVLVILWIVHLALHVGLIAWLRGHPAEAGRVPRFTLFVRQVSIAGAWAGLVATTVMGGLVTLLTLCVP